jgi:hypothetical protein
MFARRNLRRRIEDALATASPLALAEAMDAQICSRSIEGLRSLVERSRKRMDAPERSQLDLYIKPGDGDDLLGHRFSAFLRQNPRALTSLDPDVVEAILLELGSLPPVERAHRRLPANAVGLLVLILVVAVLPLAAQYAHQRWLISGLTDPLGPPALPFMRTVAAHPETVRRIPRRVARSAHHAAPRIARIARRRSAPIRYRIAHRRVHGPVAVAWKFDRANNPYFNRSRWHHPYVADRSVFGARARLTVRGYLAALVSGDLREAMRHLGLPPGGDTNAITELPIVARSSSVAITGSSPQVDGREKVEANIVTRGREYYEVFYVEQDGPAMRIADRYYIPVNRSAQIAARLFEQGTH